MAPADREPGPGHNTLARSPPATWRPRLPIAAHTERRHRTPGFLEEAATQNAERLHAHHPQGSATMPRDHIAISDRIVRQGRLELARARCGQLRMAAALLYGCHQAPPASA